MPRSPTLVALLLTLALPACSSSTSTPEASQPTTPNALWSTTPNPPDNFWIDITILGPVRSGGVDGVSAYDALPRALRPGRYIVEPDQALRVALGVGAKQTYFPPQTRRLTNPEFAELWRAAAAAGLLDPKHPNLATGSGEIDPETIQGKTVYIITTHASGRREMVVMEADPACGEWCAKAKSVVEWMAAKAWIKPPAASPTEGK